MTKQHMDNLLKKLCKDSNMDIKLFIDENGNFTTLGVLTLTLTMMQMTQAILKEISNKIG